MRLPFAQFLIFAKAGGMSWKAFWTGMSLHNALRNSLRLWLPIDRKECAICAPVQFLPQLLAKPISQQALPWLALQPFQIHCEEHGVPSQFVVLCFHG